MDIESMTPEEIREYAARKEANSLYKAHVDIEGTRAEKKPYERDVTVRDHTYRVDMRRVKDRTTMKKILEVNSIESEEERAIANIDLMDYVFEPLSKEIEEQVRLEVGYVDFEIYYTICAELYEAVGGKN